jgi:hypothetical protein
MKFSGSQTQMHEVDSSWSPVPPWTSSSHQKPSEACEPFDVRSIYLTAKDAKRGTRCARELTLPPMKLAQAEPVLVGTEAPCVQEMFTPPAVPSMRVPICTRVPLPATQMRVYDWHFGGKCSSVEIQMPPVNEHTPLPHLSCATLTTLLELLWQLPPGCL